LRRPCSARPPDAIKGLIGLTARSCRDNADSLALLDSTDTERLRQQVPGWRVVASNGAAPLIQHEWTLKDEQAAKTLAASIQQIADTEGHPVALRRVGAILIAELTTPSLGGLTENDFIVAAKVNELDIKPLLPQRKPRFWA
jgi:4a-hydroxytetrahydrobiopterin dehydratase